MQTERWVKMQNHSYFLGRKKSEETNQTNKKTQGATTGTFYELDTSKTENSLPTSTRPASKETLYPQDTRNIQQEKNMQQEKEKGGKGASDYIVLVGSLSELLAL